MAHALGGYKHGTSPKSQQLSASSAVPIGLRGHSSGLQQGRASLPALGLQADPLLGDKGPSPLLWLTFSGPVSSCCFCSRQICPTRARRS